MSATRAIAREVGAAWRDATRPQRVAYTIGGALIGVGLGHLVGWLILGGPWLGPVAWRKPFSFGISFGLTTATLGWLAGYLRFGATAQWRLVVPLAVANSTEVAWVTLQRARGVRSHFNFATLLDSALFALGGAAVAVTVAVIVVLAVRAFGPVDGPEGMAVAVRVSLVCLFVAQLAGGLMIYHGVSAVLAGAELTMTWGRAGIMKVPHFVGMHGIQLLPGLAVALGAVGAANARRVSAAASASFAALVAVSVVQVLAGLAPWGLTLVTGPLLVAALATGLGAAVAAFGSLRRAGGDPRGVAA